MTRGGVSGKHSCTKLFTNLFALWLSPLLLFEGQISKDIAQRRKSHRIPMRRDLGNYAAAASKDYAGQLEEQHW